MMTSLLRPLTLTAVGDAGDDRAAGRHADEPGAGPGSAVRRARAAATTLPVTGLPTGARPAIAYAFATKPEFLGGNFRVHRPAGTVSRIGFLALGQWSTMGRGVFGIAATEVGPAAPADRRPRARSSARAS